MNIDAYKNLARYFFYTRINFASLLIRIMPPKVFHRRLSNRPQLFLNSTVLGAPIDRAPSKSYTKMKFYTAISSPRQSSIRISYRRVNFIPIEFRAQSADRLRYDRILRWLLGLPQLFARYCARVTGIPGPFINLFEKPYTVLPSIAALSLDDSDSYLASIPTIFENPERCIQKISYEVSQVWLKQFLKLNFENGDNRGSILSEKILVKIC